MINTRLQARKLFLTLICIELLLVVAYGTDAWVHGSAEQLDAVIDLDAEGNLPAWFSSFQLALIAISLWVLAARLRDTQRPSRRFLRTCGWLVLLLSIDETAMIHERITASLGSRYIEWVPAYLESHLDAAILFLLILVACMAAAYPHLRGVWQMSPVASLIAATGCVVYVTGAAVLETVGYKMISAGVSLAFYRFEVAAEEFLEMLGATLVLYAVLLLCVTRPKKQGASLRFPPALSVTLPSLKMLTKPRAVSSCAIVGARRSIASAESLCDCSSIASSPDAYAGI